MERQKKSERERKMKTFRNVSDKRPMAICNVWNCIISHRLEQNSRKNACQQNFLSPSIYSISLPQTRSMWMWLVFLNSSLAVEIKFLEIFVNSPLFCSGDSAALCVFSHSIIRRMSETKLDAWQNRKNTMKWQLNWSLISEIDDNRWNLIKCAERHSHKSFSMPVQWGLLLQQRFHNKWPGKRYEWKVLLYYRSSHTLAAIRRGKTRSNWKRKKWLKWLNSSICTIKKSR